VFQVQESRIELRDLLQVRPILDHDPFVAPADQSVSPELLAYGQGEITLVLLLPA
jgi:hypothetical protein